MVLIGLRASHRRRERGWLRHSHPFCTLASGCPMVARHLGCAVWREEWVEEVRDLPVGGARAVANCQTWALRLYDSCIFNSLFWEMRDF